MYQIIKINIFLIIFIMPVWAQFGLAVSTAFEQYDQRLGYETSPAINIGTSYHFSSAGILGFEFQNNDLKQKVATPSGFDFIPVVVSDFILTYSYPLINNLYTLNIRPMAGLGFKSFQKIAYTVHLGALGNKNLAETNERFFTARFAIDISRKIYKQVFLFMRPQISFYDFANTHKIYSIAGGINVSFF